jgi:hypothetical protein
MAVRRPGPLERGPGAFRRDVGDGEHAEIEIAERVYRVRITELS